MFAVVDIETTGGNAEKHRIIEVAVRITDGSLVYHQFETLIHPGVKVPRGITALTGIDDAMLEGAPSFAAVSSELYHLLHDKVFVAHHVNFDYSFLKSAFDRCGISFEAPRLCTVKLGRKAFPQLAGYGLGKLSHALGIEMSQRHRAGGDANATVQVFQKICSKLGPEKVLNEWKGSDVRLPSHLSEEEWNKLPQKSGVYKLLDKNCQILYIGKAKRIKDRVLQHFDYKRGKSALSLKEIYHIDYELCGNDWAASLLEIELIKKHYPLWNIAGKKNSLSFAINTYLNQEKISKIFLHKIGKFHRVNSELHYKNLNEAREAMWKIVAQNELCMAMSFTGTICENENCYCKNKNRKKVHEHKIKEAFSQANSKGYRICGPGRHEGEYCEIEIENGYAISIEFINKHSAIIETNFGNKKDLNVRYELRRHMENSILCKYFLNKYLQGLLTNYQLIDDMKEKEVTEINPTKKEREYYVFERKYKIASEA